MTSLALLTDLYQLTMADGYFATGMHEQEACFHLYFRKPPFGSGYTIAAGLGPVIDFLEAFSFDESDIAYLRTLKGIDDKPLFHADFLSYLSELEFSCDIDAVEEGTPVFANEPLLRVKGPILQCQLLETALLNILNFQTLIATKSARVSQAAEGQPILEFGLRRAQGVDGGISASRAAYVGGCAATSNVMAGKKYDIPVRGTHAHSWVMAFDNEIEAFRAFAKAMPGNTILLVDTYDTFQGIRNAITVGLEMKARGEKLLGIRLDSGDLAYLSIEARKMLDEAGLHDAEIVASNNLDEYIIGSLKDQGAKISIWGVGTKLATAFDQPALGGVYKLGAINDGGHWDHRLKLSEQTSKSTTPGIHQVLRFFDGTHYIGDLLYDELTGVSKPHVIVDPTDMTRRKPMPASASVEPMLVPIYRQGKKVYEVPSIHDSRDRTIRELSRLHPGIRRFVNPHEYPVGFDLKLYELKTRLILEARGIAE